MGELGSLGHLYIQQGTNTHQKGRHQSNSTGLDNIATSSGGKTQFFTNCTKNMVKILQRILK